MRFTRSLQARLGISIGVLLTILWLGAASITAFAVRREIDEVFDSSLRETAQRLLPLAVVEIFGRDQTGVLQRLAAIRERDEHFSYIVSDDDGQLLLQSNGASSQIFPPYEGPGFQQTETHRIYSDEALSGSIRISVAEPLAHRADVAREIQIGLGLPLLLVIPIALIAAIIAVRASFTPLRRFRDGLAARNARDLSPLPTSDLPTEIAPLATTLNGLLERLNGAFEAERSFAANAAHELRTPLAGAIAQAQRLRAETSDPAAGQRARDIEATLKRLTRLAERLMQLARAEGGRMRRDQASDIRAIVQIVVDDMSRASGTDRIVSTLPESPVMSDLDPDILGILCRNLIENALRYGADGAPVEVALSAGGKLSVANDGPVVEGDVLNRLTTRFERGSGKVDGSGLGLAIVAAIAERIGSPLSLSSPRPGHRAGFEAAIDLPIARRTVDQDAITNT